MKTNDNMKNPGVTVLDGAMGTALRARGVKVPDYKSSIWSALALLEAPDDIRQLHQDYIAAGADVITANNYAVTPILLAREGLEDRVDELTQTACKLASEARQNSGKDIKIAGSLPPLDTTYRADLVGSFEDNLKVYRRLAKIMAPHVDILLCETMTTAEEARAAATAGVETGKDVWVSWTLASRGNVLRGGESIEEAVRALEGLPVKAMLFNCSATNPVTDALPQLIAKTSLPVGAYCNPVLLEPEGIEPERVPKKRLDANAYAGVVSGWVNLGASIVGGCCDTDPNYISEICKTLKQ